MGSTCEWKLHTHSSTVYLRSLPQLNILLNSLNPSNSSSLLRKRSMRCPVCFATLYPFICAVNYLAHLYLSGDNPALRLGNFIADHLKNRPISYYSADIQRGIRLHHAIDRYTDQHPVVAQSKARLQPDFRKYAPVIVDVFYDHFLAKDWLLYHPQPLPDYAAAIYEEMKSRHELLPTRAQEMLPFMERYDWLTNYARMEGIRRVMTGMSRRARFESGMERAPDALEEHITAFGAEFDTFFPDLQQFVADFIEQNPE